MKYDELVSKPFFKKETDNTNYQQLEELKETLSKTQLDTEKSQNKLLEYQKNIKELEKEKRDLEYDREFYNKELKRISTIMDPNGINPEIIIARLRAEDNNKYRELMHDLKQVGDEPDWLKQDTLDSINKDNSDLPEIVK